MCIRDSTRSDKVVYRFPDCITGKDGIQRSVIGIGKEYGLNVGIVHADMLHTVLLFITTSQLVLLDLSLIHILQPEFAQENIRRTVEQICRIFF